ncbi:hypothetical protein H5410_060427 [Solanum commersonii]|uniref:Uncharacterized protein n=1 Tax=Solanum commersonii TaxID=4109 RepID=A0A9J5W521_SOLCO|nr:hypothetical protein H5410_060427 [Solanum commersonii]
MDLIILHVSSLYDRLRTLMNKVQVAFNPLTLRGLPESFIAALRDDRNHNWKKSLIGTIQTSLAYGPSSLQDENSLSSLFLNVKLHGYDYMPGTEVLNDGTIKISFSEPSSMLIENHSMSSRMTRSNSSYISPVDYIVQVPSRASTSQIRKNYRYDNRKVDIDNIKDFTLSNGEITKLVFPPQQSFQINKNDEIMNFNVFSKLSKMILL